MDRRMVVAMLAGGALLAGCEVPGDGGALVGPDRSLSEALEIGAAQWDAVGRIAAVEGPTRWADLPRGGSGAYRGVVTGWSGGGPRLDHVADLALDLDFDRREVSGSVGNVVTEGVAGFGHPEGTVGLSGVLVRGDRGEARIVVGGTGVLEAGGSVAEVTLDGSGALLGGRAQGIEGRHATDFVWTRGPLSGAVSRSDGVFTAVAGE
jgi:hypothetical protein